MVTVLRSRSQITIPSAIVASLGLKEGDQLDISEVDGTIQMIPVVVYPKTYVEQLQNEVLKLKENIQSGNQPVFRSVDEMLYSLEDE